MWRARGGHLPPPSLHFLDPQRSNIHFFFHDPPKCINTGEIFGLMLLVQVMFFDSSMTSTQRCLEKGWAIILLLMVASISQAEEAVCRRRADPETPQLSKDGDIMLGGVFSFHSKWQGRRDTYMHKPLPLQCTR